jgi:hypothetical protein
MCFMQDYNHKYNVNSLEINSESKRFKNLIYLPGEL